MAIFTALAILLVIAIYYTYDYFYSKKDSETKGADYLTRALKKAQSWWKQEYNEDLEPVISNERWYGYWVYGFIFRRTSQSSNPGEYVWIVVRMDKGIPKIATFTGSPKIYEYSHKSVPNLLKELWKSYHPDYSGSPTDNLTPEEDIGYLRSKARRTQEIKHFGTDEKKDKKNILSQEKILDEGELE